MAAALAAQTPRPPSASASKKLVARYLETDGRTETGHADKKGKEQRGRYIVGSENGKPKGLLIGMHGSPKCSRGPSWAGRCRARRISCSI